VQSVTSFVFLARPLPAQSALKIPPDRNLCAAEPKLIEITAALVTEVIIKCPVTDFRIEVTGNLTSQREIALPGYIGSDAEPANIGFTSHQCCLVSRLGLFSLSLIMNPETPNEAPVAEEERGLLARRWFLQSIGKWSGAAIAAAVLTGAWLIDPPETKAGAWVNRRGGVGVAGSTAGAAEVGGLIAGRQLFPRGVSVLQESSLVRAFGRKNHVNMAYNLAESKRVLVLFPFVL
jgi:hypothetical protein